MIELHLPFPVSVNAMYSNKGKRRIKSPRYAVWRKSALWALKAQYKEDIIDGPVMLQIALSPSCNRKRDLDNHAKAIQDVLSGVVLEDDSQIKFLAMWWEPESEGYARVIVTPLNDPTAQKFVQSFKEVKASTMENSA